MSRKPSVRAQFEANPHQEICDWANGLRPDSPDIPSMKLRERFEAWHQRSYGYVPNRAKYTDGYARTEDELTWVGYRAGFAAGRRK